MKNLFLLYFCFFVFAGCSKKDPEPSTIIDAPTLDIKYDQNHQFALQKGAEDVFASIFIWKSSDEKVGKIDANGIFTARKIGETTITGTSSDGTVESKIKISPYMSFFTEPIIDFGTTAAIIKNKEKRKFLTESASILLFEGENSQIRNVAYYIENGKISSAIVLFENTSNTVTNTATFFKERYPDNGLVESNAVFLNDDRKYGLMLSVHESLGFNAIYTPGDSGGRLMTSSDKSKFKEELAKVLKRLN